MPSDLRLSPRAAIRNWLACADRPAESVEIGSDNLYNPKYIESRVDTDKSRQEKHHKHSRSRQIGCESERKAEIAHDVSLAERLGLHAPFKKFADRDTDDRLQFDNSSRRKKRGRSLTSSSLLESPEGSLNEEHSHEKARHQERLVRNHDRERSVSELGSETRGFVREVPTTSSGPAKRYERKPRHKTKSDKYEVKKDGKGSRKRKRGKGESTGASRQDRKSKRKERSGDAMMHAFSAPNVAQDRLTIRPVAPTGLFGKGRASSPLRRRGLPDLTFSEVAFLNPRRPTQDTVAQPVPEKKRRRKDKAADAEEEMSRFFTAKPAGQRGDATRQDQNSRRPSGTYCIAKDFEGTDKAKAAAFSLPVELPDLPFLGFGSSGMNTISPVKVTVPSDAPCGMITPRRPRSSTRSSIGSSSYYTWTATPSSKAHRQFRTDGKKPYSSSIARCHSRFKENTNDKAPHIPNIDLETNHKSLEDQALSLNDVLPDKSYRTEKGQAEKAFCSGQKPQPGAITHVSSLAGREPADITPADGAPADGALADGELADGEPADEGLADSVPDQNLREEAHDQAGNKCQGATKLEAKEQTENDFSIHFDEALERLLETCNFPSHEPKNPISTPRMSESNDQFQDRDGVDRNSKSKNVSKLEGNLAPNSQSISSCSERLKRDLGLQSPHLTNTNDTTSFTTSPLDNDNGNHSTALAHTGRGSGSSTDVPARSISTQETDAHISILGRGRQHPTESLGILSTDAWRGYRNIYEGQILPVVETGRNKYDISCVGSFFDQRGETWPTHQNDSVQDMSFEGFPAIGAESLSCGPQNVQDNPDSYDDNTRDWQSNSYPLYDESQFCRDVDYRDATNVLEDNISTLAFSLSPTKRTEIPSETFDSPDARNMTTCDMSTNHYGDDNTLNDHQRLDDNDEPCDAHWAGFWRPNKLY